MHILMLGAGAMGSLLGAGLAQTGAQVLLLSTNEHHIRSIRQNGLIVEELDGTQRCYSLPAYHHPDAVQVEADLVIIMVKSYATREALSSVRGCFHSSTVFLTLQNGIGNWERIAELVGEESVLAGITAQGATLLGPGHIRHGGNGPTFIGEMKGPSTERVHCIVDLFRRAGFEAHAGEQMKQLVWEKLMINVGINAITALTGIRNGVIAELESAGALCKGAVEEALKVAEAKGINLPENMVDKVISVARATAVNRSSMGQDVDRGRRTEIDAINGAIVGFGQETGVPTPINWTLTQLVKMVESLNR